MNIRIRNLIEYKEYAYTFTGELWHVDPAFKINPITKNKIKMLEFVNEGKYYCIEELPFFVSNFFGGELNLPIKFRDNDPSNLESTNIYYDIPLF